MRTRLSVQQTLFLNECSFLLHAVLQDSQQVDDILRAESEAPMPVHLEARFQERLGNSYGACISLVQDIKEQLEEIYSDLRRLSHSCSIKDNCVKELTSNIKSAIKIGLKKHGYGKKIDNLKKNREDLASLASHINKMENQTDKSLKPRATAIDDTVTHFLAIRKASRALHEAFADAWCRSCQEAAHVEHNTILCLDAQVNECVRLDLAISNARPDNKGANRQVSARCFVSLGIPLQQKLLIASINSLLSTVFSFVQILWSWYKNLTDKNRPSFPEPPIWLYVRSVTGKHEAHKLFGKRRLQVPQALISGLEDTDYSQSTGKRQGAVPPKPLNPTPLYRQQKKRKSYHHEVMNYAYCRNGPELNDFEPQTVPDIACNLSAMDNICQHFKEHACNSMTGENCYGYLQTSTDLRHFVYAAPTERRQASGSVQRLPVTLAQVIQTAIDDAMSVPEQLKIAHKLALAVLQFHSTPWMNSQWDLEDVGLFRSSGAFDESALQTLHLSARFPKDASARSPGCDLTINDGNDSSPKDGRRMTAVSNSPCSCPGLGTCYCDPESLEYQVLNHGVANMMLSSLGVALVQIGCRKPLDILRADRKDPNNLFTARQTAKHGVIPLGPQYQNIVRKCLGCDFGSGSNLESAELQGAVFTDVVCELESMVKTLSL